MSADLRTPLERLTRRVDVRPDAFERLERRRRSRERNRRITAGVVALALTIGGTLAALTAFRGADGGIADGNRPFYGLWPDQTWEGIEVAEDRIESGDPDAAWRGDPVAVASRFATDVLMWPAVDVSVDGPFDADEDEWAFLEIRVPPGSDCTQLVADAACPADPTSVTLRRAGRVWNVEEVATHDLFLPLVAGERVASGTPIVVETNLSDGEAVSMGVAFLSPCEALGRDVTVVASGGQLAYTVPDVPDGCTGYVYALQPATARGAVAVGTFLFDDAESVPAIGYLIGSISAVPVRFVDEAVPDVAEFTCNDSGEISPTRAAVAARADGVHVRFRNVGDEPSEFQVGEFDRGQGETWGTVAPGETDAVTVQFPPGTHVVACANTTPGDIAAVASQGSLSISDPASHYVDDVLPCPIGDAFRSIPPSGEGTAGFRGEPADIARDHLEGLQDGDRVEPAGYPHAEERVVRVVRDGRNVATVHFLDDGNGGWIPSSMESCADVPIEWASLSGPTSTGS